MNETNKIFCNMIHSKLKEKSGKNGEMRMRDVNCIMGKIFHIPKEHRVKVLKEMEKLQMVRLVKKTRIEINGVEIR